ncbi:MAG: YkgJ family cysteine cluster protein [Thiobacillaceae bacterium]
MRILSTRAWLKSLYGNRPDILAVTMKHAERIIAKLSKLWDSSKHAVPSYPLRYHELIAAADIEIDDILSKTKNIPCRLGCNYCCRDERIPLTDTEAVLITKHIEEKLSETEKARLLESISDSSPTSDSASEPCAFLIDGRCAVYESRPLNCRTYFSTSEASCQTFLLDKTRQPQYWLAPKMLTYAVREVSRGAKYSRQYEINALFKRIYADPEKPAQWAAGIPTDEVDLADPE